MFDALSDKIEF